MPHNDYVRTATSGVWSPLDVPTAAEFTYLDQTLFKAINGDDGGTWAPAAVITIGGLGLTVTGPLIGADAQITITSGKFLTIASGGTMTLQNGATATFSGTTTITSSFTFTSTSSIVMLNGATATIQDGAGLTVLGSVSVNATGFVGLYGTAELNGTNTMSGIFNYLAGNKIKGVPNLDAGATFVVSAGGKINVLGSVEWQSGATWAMKGGSAGTVESAASITTNAGSVVAVLGSLNIESGGVARIKSGAQLSHQGLVVKSGSTSITHIREQVLPDSNTTINPWEADIWLAGSPTANRSITLANYSGAGTFEFAVESHSYPSGFSTELKRANGTQIFIFAVVSSFRLRMSVTIYWSTTNGRYEIKTVGNTYP